MVSLSCHCKLILNSEITLRNYPCRLPAWSDKPCSWCLSQLSLNSDPRLRNFLRRLLPVCGSPRGVTTPCWTAPTPNSRATSGSACTGPSARCKVRKFHTYNRSGMMTVRIQGPELMFCGRLKSRVRLVVFLVIVEDPRTNALTTPPRPPLNPGPRWTQAPPYFGVVRCQQTWPQRPRIHFLNEEKGWWVSECKFAKASDGSQMWLLQVWEFANPFAELEQMTAKWAHTYVMVSV